MVLVRLKTVSCFSIVIVLMMACGASREVEVPQRPSIPPPPPPGNGGEGEDSFADVQPIILRSCERCHSGDGFIRSEAAWRQSNARNRVANSSMPPPGTPEARALSAGDRTRLVNF